MKAEALSNSAISSLIPDYNKSPGSRLTTGDNKPDFMAYLNNALQEVNDLQQKAAESAAELVLGGEDYLHNTMIAYEKANLALQLTIEVRNKIVDAYQEIMRMQM